MTKKEKLQKTDEQLDFLLAKTFLACLSKIEELEKKVLILEKDKKKRVEHF